MANRNHWGPYTGHRAPYYRQDQSEEAQDTQGTFSPQDRFVNAQAQQGFPPARGDYRLQAYYPGLSGHQAAQTYQSTQGSQSLISAVLNNPATSVPFGYQELYDQAARNGYTAAYSTASQYLSPTTTEHHPTLHDVQATLEVDRQSNYSSDPSHYSNPFDHTDQSDQLSYHDGYVPAVSQLSTTTASNSGSAHQATPSATQSTDQYSSGFQPGGNYTALAAGSNQITCPLPESMGDDLAGAGGDFGGQFYPSFTDHSVLSEVTVTPVSADAIHNQNNWNSHQVDANHYYDAQAIQHVTRPHDAPWNPLGGASGPSLSANYNRDPAEQLSEEVSYPPTNGHMPNPTLRVCWRCSAQKLGCTHENPYAKCCDQCEGKVFRKAWRLSHADWIPDYCDLFIPIVLQKLHRQDKLDELYKTHVGPHYNHTFDIRMTNGVGFDVTIPATEFLPMTDEVLQQLQFFEEKGGLWKLEYSPSLSCLFPDLEKLKDRMSDVLGRITRFPRLVYSYPAHFFPHDIHQQYILSLFIHFYVQLATSENNTKEKKKDVELLGLMIKLLMLTHTMTHPLTMAWDEGVDPTNLAAHFQHIRNIQYAHSQRITPDTTPKIINRQLKMKICQMQREHLDLALQRFQTRLRSSNEECLVPFIGALVMLCMVVEEHQASVAELAYLQSWKQSTHQSPDVADEQRQAFNDTVPDAFALREDMDQKIYFLISMLRAKYSTSRVQIEDLPATIEKRVKKHDKGGTAEYRKHVKGLVTALAQWMINPAHFDYQKSRVVPTKENTRGPWTQHWLNANEFRAMNVSRLVLICLFSYVQSPPSNLEIPPRS